MPNGVRRGFRTIRALGFVQDVSHMSGNCIEADRQYQRNIFIRAPDGEETQNLDFARREIIGEDDLPVPRAQYRVDIGYQALHCKAACELLRLAQKLKALTALCVGWQSHQNGAVP